jgi:hypothetical protein
MLRGLGYGNRLKYGVSVTDGKRTLYSPRARTTGLSPIFLPRHQPVYHGNRPSRFSTSYVPASKRGERITRSRGRELETIRRVWVVGSVVVDDSTRHHHVIRLFAVISVRRRVSTTLTSSDPKTIRTPPLSVVCSLAPVVFAYHVQRSGILVRFQKIEKELGSSAGRRTSSTRSRRGLFIGWLERRRRSWAIWDVVWW